MTLPSSVAAPTETTKLEDRYWDWNGYKIRYQAAGETQSDAPSLVLIHGFGGNADHWRKNTPVLANAGFRVFAIDLIGYGYSDKPDPKSMSASGYNFYTWADQVRAFIDEVVKDKSFLICNSIGSCVGLQAAVDYPEKVEGVMILDPSLRLLNIKRQNPLSAPLVTAFQALLRETPVGEAFFGVVATENTVRNVLRQAYHDSSTVTDELVQVILNPGKTPNAPRVFLDFISYSAGPLPEELLCALSSDEFKVPVSILWGTKDPWEPVEQGRIFQAGRFACVEEFVELPGTGHCPQDEAPQLVNPRVIDFVTRHWKQ
ncbi:hypothetical protein GUITHDRAFT_65167 [Guillardia theta CCMP2712]|uniref:AB hydrolase-1 domain-containing protein n=1 Tax=Guillardia theta (strain CCMP2712) TaxID=905079 RepID=L1JW01_GUITC|nr:hypothetical protein GUITHDRAFT_65167 [Guillardia theta CCMP2712]EKX52562.1 hypothetical protein GUITHDRAFT_65167 [Guillardia theta CCMP2712]|eukprot:XP_005839542.1 hypothetical protein GUITHDRAFT_65167 [Guillardia theta CCMP2712]